MSWVCYDIFNKRPGYISASTARKVSGIRVPRGEKAKAVVLQYLLDNQDGFDILYTTYGNPKPGSYDRADSLIIARAGLEECKKSLDS